MLKGSIGTIWTVVCCVAAIIACGVGSWISFWATVSGMKAIVYDGTFTKSSLEFFAIMLGILVQYGQNPFLYINEKTSDKDLKKITAILFWIFIFFDASTNVLAYVISYGNQKSPYSVNAYVANFMYYVAIAINLAFPFIEEVGIIAFGGLIAALKDFKYGEKTSHNINWKGKLIPSFGFETKISSGSKGGGLFGGFGKSGDKGSFKDKLPFVNQDTKPNNQKLGNPTSPPKIGGDSLRIGSGNSGIPPKISGDSLRISPSSSGSQPKAVGDKPKFGSPINITGKNPVETPKFIGSDEEDDDEDDDMSLFK